MDMIMAGDANKIKAWYSATQLQIVAESYFQDINFDFSNTDAVVGVLRRGNTPPNSAPDQYVRMTPQQVTAFLGRYEIVDQLPNTSSGFSATLIRERETGRYTLAFRSTEWKNASKGGDFERDGYDGAGGELFSVGFAFGQLRDMEWYLSEMKAGRLATGNTAANGAAIAAQLTSGTIDLTGYSLGAHMATVFTELHPELVGQTIVFNAAGRGAILKKTESTFGATERQMLERFERILLEPRAGSGFGALPFAKRMQVLGASVPGQGVAGANIYQNRRYLWAVEATAAEFRTQGFGISGNSDERARSMDALAHAKITQLYGHATHGDAEATANAGVHAPARSIFIEDQPDVEGTPKLPFAPKLTGNLLGFIFDGDFYNTHSLTLVVDSLAVMNAFMQADGNLTQREAESILAAASNQRAQTSVPKGAPLAAEGDSLERALDGLRKLVNPQGFSPTGFDPKAGGFGDSAVRERFHANVNSLLAQLSGPPAVTMRITPLVPTSQFKINGEPLDSGPMIH
ncbi:MAG: hypothetical protein A3D95_07935 [Betaproteobacteria bacterium RIFCSPHIGHO2_12_FULL_69_13]|nr:MAG: hypothetical protein A3D95_07935 [Betaproteobacteria bacterium RIFCSPHIGHO2_12_FULL_69_13]OGA69763.1 MAG: hypothetical protein A3G83_16275 [Betaproteobacteria bacterium RIFCSPLOWO2_12_FULL_68_20]